MGQRGDVAECLADRRGRARGLSLRASRDRAHRKVSGSRFPRPKCTNSQAIEAFRAKSGRRGPGGRRKSRVMSRIQRCRGSFEASVLQFPDHLLATVTLPARMPLRRLLSAPSWAGTVSHEGWACSVHPWHGHRDEAQSDSTRVANPTSASAWFCVSRSGALSDASRNRVRNGSKYGGDSFASRFCERRVRTATD